MLIAGVPRLQSAKTADPPVIDGRLDEAAWKTATPTDSFTQEAPFDGKPPCNSAKRVAASAKLANTLDGRLLLLIDDEAHAAGVDREAERH